MALLPTVLYPLTLSALIDHLLSSQSPSSPTTLVVCSDRTAFLDHLAHSLKQDHHQHHHQGTAQTNSWNSLLVPTLHNLAITRHVKLAFCPSVQALLAYLTAYDRPGYVHHDQSDGQERLVLVDVLALHKPTSSFSAQGLSRTFAAAVETALRTGVALHLVECEGRQHTHDDHLDDDDDDAVMHNGEDAGVVAEPKDPWDQHVSILNLSARRFGSTAGQRTWAGRTVKAKTIAAKWFQFHNLASHHTHQDPE